MGPHGTLAAMFRSYLFVALGVGLVLAIALGGRPRHLVGKGFRWWLLLPLGVVLQSIVERDGVPVPYTILVLSYVYLLIFCLANLRHVGMGIVLIGIALNFAAIVANHGMPVRASAVRTVQGGSSSDEVVIDEVKHHLERPDSKVMALGDIVPVKPLDQVLSFGDLILAVGVVDLLVHLMRPFHRRRGAAWSAPPVAAGDTLVIDLTEPVGGRDRVPVLG
jgi:hypothetical protein